jgi:thioredoxin-like negative regulator of GroEL
VLGFVAEMDKQMEARLKQAQEFVESILEQDDVAKATQENLEGFTQDAAEVVNQMLKQASEKNDYARMGKLQKMVQVLQEASAPPPEVAFIEQLLQAPDDATLEAMLKENDAMVNQQFLEALSGLVTQMESQGGGNPEAKAMGEKLGEVYKVALKYSMKKNMG